MSKSESEERKPTLSFSIPRPLVDYLDRRKKYYKGQSPMATVAFSEFRANDERRDMQDRLLEFLKENPENEDVLNKLKNLPKDKQSMIQAYIVKGMACIVLGQAEEAKKCFDEAKRLESSVQKKNPDIETTFSEQIEKDIIPDKLSRRTKMM